MLYDVFTNVIFWFALALESFLYYGGYLGLALLCFPILRKVCYIFKQLTN